MKKGAGEGGLTAGRVWKWAICLAAVAAVFYSMTHFRVEAYETRWTNCLDSIVDGTLYGGRSECEQPPLVYVAGLLLSAFGRQFLQPMSNAFLIILHAATLILLLEHVRPRRLTTWAAAVAIYCLVLMPMSFDWNSDRECMATALAMFFVVCGIRTFPADGGRRGFIVSGLFFALAAASKVTSVPAAAAVAAVYAMKRARQDGMNARTASSAALDLAAFAAPMAALTIALTAAYPNVLTYAIFSHSFAGKKTTAQAVLDLALTNPLTDPNLFLFYSLGLAAAAYYLKTRDDTAVAYVMASFASQYSLFKQRAWVAEPLGDYKMLFPVIFMAIIAWRHIDSCDKRRALQVAAVAVLFSAFFGPYHAYGGLTFKESAYACISGYCSLERDANIVRDRVNGVFGLLPKNEGPAITDHTMYSTLVEYGPDLDWGKVDAHSMPQQVLFWDIYTDGLTHYGLFDNRTLPYKLNPREEGIKADIARGTYDMILLGPAEGHLSFAVSEASSEGSLPYCMVILPRFADFWAGNKKAAMLNKDPKKCQKLVLDARKYVDGAFDGVCEYDMRMANEMEAAFNLNLLGNNRTVMYPQLLMRKNCTSGADVIGRLEDARGNGGKITPYATAAFAAALAAAHYRPRNADKRRRRHK
jgi:hypothetical protein